MARKPRFNLVGIPQHIVQRGNNREPCFYSIEDYQRYLHDLNHAATQNACAVHAYVLMTNHVHLLVTPFKSHGLSHMMQDVGRQYVPYINHQYGRTGTLWEGRYKASLVDSEQYLLTCMRYIEMNPVRAAMVEHPGEYRWSSYAHNAHGRVDAAVSSHPLYERLGKTVAERQQAYRELFISYLHPLELHDIREALNQELVLGREDFKDKISQMIKRRVSSGVSGRPRIEEVSGVYCLL